MNSIYLDNAATTPMLPEVVALMNESMLHTFGNPSSTHHLGRKAKSEVEQARKNIAKYFNVIASEIVFTAGGTEADNLILNNAVVNLGVKTIITSKIEHHAVLHTATFLQNKYNIAVEYVAVDDKGNIILDDLKNKLENAAGKALVSLMWINNEIGNILPIKEVALLCKEYNALFHSDTVQAIGHYELNLQEIPIDFITASAHKFHGPKGVGFAYFKKGHAIEPLFHGGSQERGTRSSTENVHAILGMNKALTMGYDTLEKDTTYIKSIKQELINLLKKEIPEVIFNGESEDLEKSSYTILSVRLPIKDSMLLFNLDLKGIAASGGSACQSGSSKGSHVLQGFLPEEEQLKSSIRFSFSKLNTKEELKKVIDFFKEKLKK